VRLGDCASFGCCRLVEAEDQHLVAHVLRGVAVGIEGGGVDGHVVDGALAEGAFEAWSDGDGDCVRGAELEAGVYEAHLAEEAHADQGRGDWFGPDPVTRVAAAARRFGNAAVEHQGKRVDRAGLAAVGPEGNRYLACADPGDAEVAEASGVAACVEAKL